MFVTRKLPMAEVAQTAASPILKSWTSRNVLPQSCKSQSNTHWVGKTAANTPQHGASAKRYSMADKRTLDRQGRCSVWLSAKCFRQSAKRKADAKNAKGEVPRHDNSSWRGSKNEHGGQALHCSPPKGESW